MIGVTQAPPTAHAIENAVYPRTRCTTRLGDALVPHSRGGQDRGQECSLSHTELIRLLQEPRIGRILDAPDSGTKLHHVEVQREDRVLGHPLLHAECQEELAELPTQGSSPVEEEVLRELLRDRAAPTEALIGCSVGQRLLNGNQIKPGV